MNSLGWIHTLVAVATIVLGTVIVRETKGTRRHRMLGRAYVGCSVVVCATAFAIYNLDGSFGPFHWASVAQAGCLTAGLRPLVRRERDADWKTKHAFYMSWSYVGLLAALAGEITTRIPCAPFNMTVALSVATVVWIGSRVVKATLGRAWRPPDQLPSQWRERHSGAA